jgi:hypothetical protein
MPFNPSSYWTGDPSVQPTEYLTLADILTIGTSSTPDNGQSSTSYTLGNTTSGEVYTNAAMQFNAPGFISLPIPPGAYSDASFGGGTSGGGGSSSTFDISGNFLPTQTSLEGGQAVCYVRNDQYIVLATRDTRNQHLVGNLQMGEGGMFGQLGKGTILCKNDGSVTIGVRAIGSTVPAGSAGQNIQFSITPVGLYFTAPWGTMAFDAAGFRVTTSGGGTIGLNNSSTSGSGCTISSGTCNINSSMINLGTGSNLLPFGVAYSTIPSVAPGIPILGTGVGAVVNNASSSTTVFVSA